MPELPSGTVTFLFTDIERSTETAAALGDERWADVLADHHRLLRAAFGGSGHEVATEGDSFFVAFERAQDAVTAAANGQRALEGHAWPGEGPLRVRMGIHTGEVLVRDGGYVGHEVHRAKRISDAAHGGQVLLSQTTADLLGSSHELLDLGPHRLKDLGEPQRLYQLAGEGLERDFPRLRSLDAFTHNLPAQRSAFIGRDHEIAEVRALLADNRIVTLTGVGGCGKTRLALQVGAESLDDFPGGVYFVNLAPIADPDDVMREAASAVGGPIGGIASVGGAAGPSDEALFSHFGSRTSLLILDNCEHLVDACADLADRILERCEAVTILATSREGLRVEGEQSWVVPSLSLPDDAAGAQASESVSLFKARARAVRPGFDLTPDNIDAVVEICRRLDGIPLAIEFAAARVSHLSPQQIAARLDDRFTLLTGGQRRVQRQHTLQATLDWSYDLLDEPEQILLRRLSVFAGDFGVDAAEGMCADGALRAGTITDLLGSLVTKSLVDADLVDDEIRYHLLETVRAYAAERLTKAEEARTFRFRHRDWYLSWLESMSWEDLYFDPLRAQRNEREQANVLAALEWSAAQGQTGVVGRLAARWFHVFAISDPVRDRWARTAVEAPDGIPADELLVLQMRAGLLNVTSAEGDVEIPERLPHDASPAIRSLALSARGLQRSVVAVFTRDDDLVAAAYRDLDESLRLTQGLPAEWAANVFWARSQADLVVRNIRAGLDSTEECIRLFRSAGNLYLAGVMSFWLAPVAIIAGERERAEAAWAASVPILEENYPGRDWELFPLGMCSVMTLLLATLESPDEAWSMLTAARRRVPSAVDPVHVDDFVLACGTLLAISEEFERAAVLLSWLRAHTFDVGRALPSGVHYVTYLHHRDVVRAALGPDEAKRARERGSAMSLDDAIGLAFAERAPT